MMPFMLNKKHTKQYHIMFMDIYMCSKSWKTMNREEINQTHGSWLPLGMEGGE